MEKIKILFYVLVYLFCVNDLFAEVINVNTDKLKILIKNNVDIIDVRTKEEWKETGIIKNSHLISMNYKFGFFKKEDWFFEFEKINLKGNSAVLICAVGGRSSYLSNLISKNYDNLKIYNVVGGIKALIKSGFTLKKF